MALDPKLRAMLDDFLKEVEGNIEQMTAQELIDKFVVAKSEHKETFKETSNEIAREDLQPGINVVLEHKPYNCFIPCRIKEVYSDKFGRWVKSVSQKDTLGIWGSEERFFLEGEAFTLNVTNIGKIVLLPE